MSGCGLRLFSKGVSNVYSSYHMLPWYIQYANACSDTFAQDLVSQGWEGQPLFWDTLAELRQGSCPIL